MIDFHSHILPGIDDGSASVEESIAMLELEAQQGITHVVCTPHFCPRYDTPERFIARRDRAEELLRREMDKYPGLPEISVGAEVLFYRGISDSEYIKQLTIRGKSCIMLEMAQLPWQSFIYEELELLYLRHGITPIVAHIDRYLRQLGSCRVFEKLDQLPVLIQANADFFLKRSSREMALRLLRSDRIQLLGSDCHNLSHRMPNLGDAVQIIEKRWGKTVIERVCERSSRTLNIVI